jgi:hypothetical protein
MDPHVHANTHTHMVTHVPPRTILDGIEGIVWFGNLTTLKHLDSTSKGISVLKAFVGPSFMAQVCLGGERILTHSVFMLHGAEIGSC